LYNKKRVDHIMAKTYVDVVKYLIKVKFDIKGIVDKPDIVGAVFGQSEGLLGEEMDLRELQRKGRVGRIEVNVKQDSGKTFGEILIPSSMDMAETSVLAAAIETVEKVGPCESYFSVQSIQDVRKDKRAEIAKRAQQLLSRMKEQQAPDIDVLTEKIRSDSRAGKLIVFGRDKLAAGPELFESDEAIVVEGRADVITLLKHGIKNAVSMGGSKVSADIAKLSRSKKITVFIDGDRGGELNVRKLHQLAKIAFVARAPDGKEVEELAQKEIIQALRRRMPVQDFLDSIGVSSRESRSNRRVPAKRPVRSVRSPSRGVSHAPISGRNTRLPAGRGRPRIQTTFGTRPSAGMSQTVSKLPAFDVPNAEETMLVSNEEKKVFEPILAKVKGKRLAKFLDDKKKELEEVPVREMVEKLKSSKKVRTIVCDGIITKRLMDAAAKAKVELIVGVKRSNVSDSPVKTLVLS
jgi:DNA primase